MGVGWDVLVLVEKGLDKKELDKKRLDGEVEKEEKSRGWDVLVLVGRGLDKKGLEIEVEGEGDVLEFVNGGCVGNVNNICVLEDENKKIWLLLVLINREDAIKLLLLVPSGEDITELLLLPATSVELLLLGEWAPLLCELVKTDEDAGYILVKRDLWLLEFIIFIGHAGSQQSPKCRLQPFPQWLISSPHI
jgi:hypothetical protein